ncbi:MAG: hypothetical protein ACLSAH_18740 [Bilophila wadsworthia]
MSLDRCGSYPVIDKRRLGLVYSEIMLSVYVSDDTAGSLPPDACWFPAR